MTAFKAHILSTAQSARADGLNNFADALIELYRQLSRDPSQQRPPDCVGDKALLAQLDSKRKLKEIRG